MKKLFLSITLFLFVSILCCFILVKTASAQAPSNDECSGAITLISSTTCNPVSGTTAGATQSIPAVDCNGFTGNADDDVWYKFVALNGSSKITVTAASDFDAVIDLRSGSCNGTNIGCMDSHYAGETEILDASNLTIGQTYYIRIYDFDAGSGEFTICVTYLPNDDCSGAILLTPSSTCNPVSETTEDATQSIPPLDCDGNTGYSDDDVWFKFVATHAAHTITVTGNSDFDAVIDLRSGSCNGTNIDCADHGADGETETLYASGLTIGQTYYIRIYDWQPGSGTFAICVTDPPSNDDCSGAITLTPSTSCNPVSGTTVGATESIFAINCDGAAAGNADDDVWYKFVATDVSTAITVTGASNFDVVIDLRSGSCNGTNIGCADAYGDGGTETLNASGLTPGATYYLRIYNYNSGGGTFTICIVSACPILTCTNITIDLAPGQSSAVVNYNPPSVVDYCCSPPTAVTNMTYLGTYGGHTYFKTNTDMTWDNANAAAIAAGGYLASINSEIENNFLKANAGSVPHWIGGYQNHSSSSYSEPGGGWQWTDGTLFSNYTDWLNGEPNNAFGTEDNLTLSNIGWNDLTKSGPLNAFVEFACEGVPQLISGPPSGSSFPIGATTITYQATDNSGNTATCSFIVAVIDTEPPVLYCPENITVNTSAGQCSAIVNYETPPVTDNTCMPPTGIIGYIYLGTFRGHTYYMVNPGVNYQTWADAESFAISTGGHLASINSAAENSFITSLADLSMFPFWIGGRQNGLSPTFSEPAGGWEWIDGNSFDVYTNWGIGEPNNGGPFEDALQLNADGTWNDADIYDERPFIIEFACTAIQPTHVSGLASGNSFPVGTTTITYSATDASGNITTCSFTVTVNAVSPPTWYYDGDGDGYFGSTQNTCTNPGAGWSNSTTGPDCNDSDALATVLRTWYLDADHDGYFISSQVSCNSPGAGYVTSGITGSGDCNDSSASINPAATEICSNNTDDNCNGQIDENCCGIPTGLSSSLITSSTARVSWNAVSSATKYTIQYKKASPSEPWLHKSVTVPATAFMLKELSSSTKYKWKVRSKCGSDKSVFSSILKFTTTSAKEGDALNAETNFSIYPNPAAHSFVVDLNIDNGWSGDADIQLINELGQVVYTVKMNVNDGEIRGEINPDVNLVSGNYLVRAIAGDKVYTGRLIIQE